MLVIDNLWKNFNGVPALQGVSFAVEKGQIYGLLGHNGAGKSTTLGIILGMVAAQSGDVSIDGISITQDRSRALSKVGAIFEAPSFYDYLSGWQNLKILMSYSGPFDEKLAREVVERVDLTKRIDSKVRTYSHGMRQRLALAQALLPEPEILLLDEPTDGLDPEGIKWFRDFILGLRAERGMTVLFNSHLLGEVEQMCDRIAILQGGKRVFEGSIKGLVEEQQGYEISAELNSDLTKIVDQVLASVGGNWDGASRIFMPHDVDPATILRSLVQAGVPLRSFARKDRSLEDLYMEIKQQHTTIPRSA
jgi:ABC-2 type transport system ATP-binding protein